MKTIITILLVGILILLAAAVAIFLFSLGFAGIGWLLSQILPLSPFEAGIIAVLSGLGLIYIISQIVTARPTYEYEDEWEDEDWEEDWDEWEDEDEEYEKPIPFPKWRPQREEVPVVGRNDPCPCGSGKKYKYCHGKKK